MDSKKMSKSHNNVNTARRLRKHKPNKDWAKEKPRTNKRKGRKGKFAIKDLQW